MTSPVCAQCHLPVDFKAENLVSVPDVRGDIVVLHEQCSPEWLKAKFVGDEEPV